MASFSSCNSSLVKAYLEQVGEKCLVRRMTGPLGRWIGVMIKIEMDKYLVKAVFGV